jgi:putative transposase
MGEIRRQHSGAFKAKVAVAAIRGERTMSELSSEYGIHPTVINRWRKQVLDVLPQILSGKTGPVDKNQEELVSRLYQEIGQLKVELDWLKKKSGL